MSDSESAVRARVKSVLVQRIGIESFDETPGGYCFRLISSRMCVLAREHAPGQVYVRLQGVVAQGVPTTPDVLRHVAVNGGNWLYGHLNVFPRDDGTATVVLRHEFAAHHMSDESLEEGVRKFGSTLEDLDDQFTAQFGGHRYYEDV
jgi:type III secretion system-like peptide-binding chaperone